VISFALAQDAVARLWRLDLQQIAVAFGCMNPFELAARLFAIRRRQHVLDDKVAEFVELPRLRFGKRVGGDAEFGQGLLRVQPGPPAL
jgi:hypothetical protein